MPIYPLLTIRAIKDPPLAINVVVLPFCAIPGWELASSQQTQIMTWVAGLGCVFVDNVAVKSSSSLPIK